MFTSTLYAMGPGPAGGGGQPGGAGMINLIMIGGIMVFFYVLLIRPQQKQAKERQELLKTLKVGDPVVTSSGMYGTIAKINEDETLMVKVAENLQIKMTRAAVEGFQKKTA